MLSSILQTRVRTASVKLNSDQSQQTRPSSSCIPSGSNTQIEAISTTIDSFWQEKETQTPSVWPTLCYGVDLFSKEDDIYRNTSQGDLSIFIQQSGVLDTASFLIPAKEQIAKASLGGNKETKQTKKMRRLSSASGMTVEIAETVVGNVICSKVSQITSIHKLWPWC